MAIDTAGLGLCGGGGQRAPIGPRSRAESIRPEPSRDPGCGNTISHSDCRAILGLRSHTLA